MGMSETQAGLIPARELAQRAGVPQSVLSFFEDQFPEIRAVKTDGGRAYRASDAALMAGLAEALYRDGEPFRDVQAKARSGGRDALIATGSEILGLSLSPADALVPAAPIPPDAHVRRRGPAATVSAPPDAPTREDILFELMGCVRTLSDARGGSS